MEGIRNYQDPSEYQQDYSTLAAKQVTGILDFMNSYQMRSDEWYEKYLKDTDGKSGEWLALHNHVEDQLSGAKDAYSVIGIKVEPWGTTDGGTWILATKADAERYNEMNGTTPDKPASTTASTWPDPEEKDGQDRTVGYDKGRYYAWNSQVGDLVWDYSHSAWYDRRTGTWYESNGTKTGDAVLRTSQPIWSLA